MYPILLMLQMALNFPEAAAHILQCDCQNIYRNPLVRYYSLQLARKCRLAFRQEKSIQNAFSPTAHPLQHVPTPSETLSRFSFSYK